jgi:DNA-binding transcriptional regulator YhcF (GntR family)
MAQEAVERGNKLLSSRMMPRDIAIHWNTTYNMLTFAYTYCQAYNELTDD